MTKQDIRWAIFMFMSLSQQAEGWAYFLKGVTTHRTKQLLNQYTASAKSLWQELLKQDGMDDLIADAEVWTETMKLFHGMPRHKQEALYLAFKEFLAGNIKIEDDDTAVVEIPEANENQDWYQYKDPVTGELVVSNTPPDNLI